MKTIFKSALLLAVGLLAMTACSDDNDSNPTIAQATSFKVNTPSVGTANVDLQKTGTITLTWSQPVFTDMQAPVVPTYTIQVSPTGTFNKEFDSAAEDNTGADFFAMGETYSTNTGAINATDLNRALVEMLQWADEAAVPAVLPLTVRVKAAVRNATFVEYSTIYSETFTLNTIPYYVELKAADPEIWWLIGADIADGSWGSDIGKCVIPMQTINGYEYDVKTGQGEIQWIGYLGGNGFKLRGALDDGWAAQWGQGDAFGEYVKNDGGSGNITVPEAGLYTVTLNTATDELTVAAYDGSAPVYDGMALSGSFNEWGDEAMTPCSTGWENHDWYITMTFDAGTEWKVKQAGSWDFNKGGSFITYTDGMYVYGVSGGDNLVMDESGTYLILFNDITGYIRVIKQ